MSIEATEDKFQSWIDNGEFIEPKDTMPEGYRNHLNSERSK